jgi:hypothetical protein
MGPESAAFRYGSGFPHQYGGILCEDNITVVRFTGDLDVHEKALAHLLRGHDGLLVRQTAVRKR